MAVGLVAPNKDNIFPVEGIRLGVASAGIKQGNTQPDLTLIELAEGTHTAAVYTQNAFCAAPVIIAKQHQAKMAPRWLLINSGNANAGTGEAGLAAAKASCNSISALSGDNTESVLPFSTGVIGELLPSDKIHQALPAAYANLSGANWYDAAHAIMTTDTIAKLVSSQFTLDGKTITLTGMTKGSGMIRPDMATMLAYIATDAAVSRPVLEQIIQQAMAQSFNRITVDGDTSTNDACVLMATGQAENTEITDISHTNAVVLVKAVTEMCQQLAQAIVRDGEGATKFIEIQVNAGRDNAECQQVAYTIAHSPLVKTAFFASDPNWGRILAAVGRSGVADFDLSLVTIYLGDVCIVRSGEPALDYTEAQGQQVMDQDDISITVELGRGEASDTVWTCDFSYDYVKINAEYRS